MIFFKKVLRYLFFIINCCTSFYVRAQEIPAGTSESMATIAVALAATHPLVS